MAQLEFRNTVWEVPESSSLCASWKIYFNQLKAEFGKQNARQIWLLTWEQNGSNTCTTDAEFNQWLQQNDIDVSNAATRAIASGGKLVNNVLGLGASLTSFMRVVVPVALLLVLGLVAFGAYRSAKTGKLPGIANLTPVGRAANLAMGS